jgi:hypothetical protein
MSGYAPDNAERAGQAADLLDGLHGAVFVPKPFDPNGLVTAVRTAIDRMPA